MQTKTKAILILLPFILTACKFNPFAFFNKTKDSSESTEVLNEIGTDNDSFIGSISGIFNLGKKVQCTFEYSDDMGSNSGKVYVSGDSMRGDFETIANGITKDTHMIKDNRMNYIWSESEGYGIVTEDPEVTEENKDLKDFKMPDYGGTEGNDSDKEYVDLNQNYEYKCSSWIPDKKKFEVPGEIEFLDLKAQMEELTKSIRDTVDIDCSTCDSLPEGDARTQCLVAIGCN